MEATANPKTSPSTNQSANASANPSPANGKKNDSAVKAENRLPTRQVSGLKTGDQILLLLQHAFEIESIKDQGDEYRVLKLKPIPCSEHCPIDCDCDTTLFSQFEGEIDLKISSAKRPKYLGNPREIEQNIARLQSQLKSLHSNGNTSSNGNGH